MNVEDSDVIIEEFGVISKALYLASCFGWCTVCTWNGAEISRDGCDQYVLNR